VAVDQLPLERGNEALGHRVVVGIGHRSHRGQKAFFPEPAPELHRGVLAAPIGVVNQRRRWPARVNGHVHGIEDQFRPKVVRHGPSYDPPGVSVEHEREVEPAFPASDVSDVRDPQAIRSLRGEVAFHQIRGRGSALGLRAQSRTSPLPGGARRVDCTTYVLDVLESAFAAKGQASAWAKVMSTARTASGSGGLKGTEVLQALQSEAGWEGVF
jgi:hypothetical protein